MGLGVRVIRGLGVGGFVLGAVVLGSFTAAVGTAQVVAAQTASQIAVEGNRRVEAETIRSYFHLGPGERLDAAKIDAGLKALYATGLFQDVKINHAGGRLVVSVIENPVINRVAFEGNKKAKDEQLSAEIQSKPRGTFSRAVVQSDTQRIIEVYQRSGRYDVHVEPKIIELPNNRVDLVFEINEGPKTSVKQIVFVGNHAFSDYRLKDVIKTGQANWLSWLKNNDIYDPDRVEVDRDLLRRFYLKNGFADVRIVSAVGEYDPSRQGFVVTFTIEEGPQYRFGTVDIQSNVAAVTPASLRSVMTTSPGSVYNADAVQKSVEDMTIAIAKRGYPFASVRPRGDRDFENRRVNLVYVVEEGQRLYIERINIRGNTRTRDYVIRREFDIVEGDAYNRALVDRAERRLKNLNYFKSVKITNEPGSAPDRIVLDVDVEEQSTGEFSVAGGYSTADGLIGEISIGERNLLGRGQVARAAVQFGQRARGFDLSFVEPYFLGYRLALGLDVFDKETTQANYVSYTSKMLGGGVRLGIPITDNLTFTPRYSAYRQEIELDPQFNNCNNINPDNVNTFPVPTCYQDGEASLAVRKELAQGPVLVSLVGYGLSYNTLDNIKNPTSGLAIDFKQDFAGVGGDVNFIKSIVDSRYYYEVLPDIISVTRVQAGHITGWGGDDVRMLDHFQGGPNLVRGFEPAGWGPRDLTPGTNQDPLGGTMYWAASLELQTPLFFAPKDFGMRAAVFADAGQLWDYRGPTFWDVTGESLTVGDSKMIRSSVGAGLIWDSPFGPLRFDFAYALSKESYDRTQIFRFGGGTKF
ncbi:MAG TPA: outer membrane protein assembly factor BamA [Xanthobacteraceae bacterium]|jgi:outer membrane protein insertion porin family|nr:outer membrane protein assembly factor BamA [Xanthobacteraceae bacterium]